MSSEGIKLMVRVSSELWGSRANCEGTKLVATASDSLQRPHINYTTEMTRNHSRTRRKRCLHWQGSEDTTDDIVRT